MLCWLGRFLLVCSYIQVCGLYSCLIFILVSVIPLFLSLTVPMIVSLKAFFYFITIKQLSVRWCTLDQELRGWCRLNKELRIWCRLNQELRRWCRLNQELGRWCRLDQELRDDADLIRSLGDDAGLIRSLGDNAGLIKRLVDVQQCQYCFHTFIWMLTWLFMDCRITPDGMLDL